MPRKKKFDPDRALDEAVDVFWEKGYNASSVQDLVDRMGINRFSMYDTFGGKRELFLAALDRYRETQIDELFARLEAGSREPAGLDAIQEFFRRLIEVCSGCNGWRGCLITNSAVELAPHDRTVAKRVSDHLQRMEDAFRRALSHARKAGELKKGSPMRDLARFLTGAVVGLTVLAKTSPGRRALERYAATVLGTVTAYGP